MKSILKKLAITIVLVIGFKLLPITYGVNIGDLDRQNDLYNLYYKSVVFLLDNIADENDTVILHIDSHGGVVLTGLDLINSTLNTDAYTIAHIKTGAFSGGAFLAIAADKITAENYSSILFHKARYYDFRGRAVIVDNIVIDRYAKERLYKFLTLEQIEFYEKGGDLEIDGRTFANIYNSR